MLKRCFTAVPGEENSEDKSLVTLKADELDIVQNIVKCTNDLNDVQDVVKCADHLNNVQDITKSTTTKRKSKLPKRNPKVSNAQISNDAKACNSTDNEDSGNGSNCNDLIAQHDLVDDDNAFINDYYSCDDDFEWKEEDNNGTSASKSTESKSYSHKNTPDTIYMPQSVEPIRNLKNGLMCRLFTATVVIILFFFMFVHLLSLPCILCKLFILSFAVNSTDKNL